MPRSHFLAAFIAAAAPAAPFTSEAASPIQRQCKAPITTVALDKAKQKAQLIAKRSWSQQAATQHGSVWASVGNASVSQNACSFGHAGWSCTFAARPCRHVNTAISPDKPGLLQKQAPGGLNRP